MGMGASHAILGRLSGSNPLGGICAVLAFAEDAADGTECVSTTSRLTSYRSPETQGHVGQGTSAKLERPP